MSDQANGLQTIKRTLSLETMQQTATSSKRTALNHQHLTNNVASSSPTASNTMPSNKQLLDEELKQLKELFPNIPEQHIILLLNKYINIRGHFDFIIDNLANYSNKLEKQVNSNSTLQKTPINTNSKSSSNQIAQPALIVIDSNNNNHVNTNVDLLEIDNESDNESNNDSQSEGDDEDEGMNDFANMAEDFILTIFPNLNLIAAHYELAKIYKWVYKHGASNENDRQNQIVELIIQKDIHRRFEDDTNERSDYNKPTTSANAMIRSAESNLINTGSQSIEILDDFNKISRVIKDVDPDYLNEQLNLNVNDPNRSQLILNNLLENPTYPKLKDYLNRKNRQKEIDSYLNVTLNVDEFLKLYPNPVDTFYKSVEESSENYRNHCRTFLCNKFKLIAKESIEQTLKEFGYRLTPTYKILDDAVSTRENSLKTRLNTHLGQFSLTYRELPPLQVVNNQVAQEIRNNNLNNNPNMVNQVQELTPQAVQYDNTRQRLLHLNKIKFSRKKKFYKLENYIRKDEDYPSNLDGAFFKELLFVNHENEIKNYIAEKKRLRQEKFDLAKAQNKLIECGCCYNDDYLDEDMVSCESEHKFCKNCVKRHAETRIGESKYEFECLSSGCKSEFAMTTLSNVLDPNSFSKMITKMQIEQIKKANIDNLEECLHCTYAAIIENPDDKVFYCLNPSCMKEHCRLCKEANHLPLRCNEIEKRGEVHMRTWIENRVTESMIRVCYKCNKRFYKTEGCNMMHCPCGAVMCYVCRQPVTDSYGHFQKGKCEQNTNVAKLHEEEMTKAYEEARQEYLKKHPEYQDVKLKYDPKKHLDDVASTNAAISQQLQQQQQQNQLNFLQNQPGQFHVIQPRQIQQQPIPLQVPRQQPNQQPIHLQVPNQQPIPLQAPRQQPNHLVQLQVTQQITVNNIQANPPVVRLPRTNQH